MLAPSRLGQARSAGLQNVRLVVSVQIVRLASRAACPLAEETARAFPGRGSLALTVVRPRREHPLTAASLLGRLEPLELASQKAFQA